MNKHRPRLRAPLVVTVITGAALAACGGSVVTPNETCPSEAPTDGSGCAPSLRGSTCNFVSCQGRLVTSAVCRADTGRWQVPPTHCETTPPMRACPAVQPTNGAACNGALDPASCSYGWSDCLRGPESTAVCESGAWRIAVSTCNPPAPTCPAVAPVSGDACVLPSPTECTYGDCAGSPTIFARCEGGRWSVAQSSCNPPPPPPPVCPAAPPTPEAPCALPNGHDACGYGDCYGTPTDTAQCVDGRWRLTSLGCNPPPPMACPTEVPFEGDTCTHAPSAECHYGDCGTRPALNFTCRSGRWWLTREMCGDYCPASRPRAGAACSRDAMAPCRYPGAVCGDTQLQNEAQCNPMTHRWVITEFVCR